MTKIKYSIKRNPPNKMKTIMKQKKKKINKKIQKKEKVKKKLKFRKNLSFSRLPAIGKQKLINNKNYKDKIHRNKEIFNKNILLIKIKTCKNLKKKKKSIRVLNKNISNKQKLKILTKNIKNKFINPQEIFRNHKINIKGIREKRV